jgi:hypothetical protein
VLPPLPRWNPLAAFRYAARNGDLLRYYGGSVSTTTFRGLHLQIRQIGKEDVADGILDDVPQPLYGIECGAVGKQGQQADVAITNATKRNYYSQTDPFQLTLKPTDNRFSPFSLIPTTSKIDEGGSTRKYCHSLSTRIGGAADKKGLIAGPSKIPARRNKSWDEESSRSAFEVKGFRYLNTIWRGRDHF